MTTTKRKTRARKVKTTAPETGWLDIAKEGLAKATCIMYGLEWESEEALSFIRYAYQEEAASPQPARTDDVLYIDLTIIPDNPTNWTAVKYGDSTADVIQSVALDGVLTFYGPHAAEYAEHAHTIIMIDTGPDSPRDILRRYCMIIEGKPDAPSIVREPEGDMWRLRADLHVRLNLRRVVPLPYSKINGAPDIVMSVQP